MQKLLKPLTETVCSPTHTLLQIGGEQAHLRIPEQLPYQVKHQDLKL